MSSKHAAIGSICSSGVGGVGGGGGAAGDDSATRGADLGIGSLIAYILVI
jgi:hypothetical protein